MLLNWHTIDACFLSSAFHIRSSFVFFLTCLGSFLLIISLEALRRFQRSFERHLRSRRARLQEEQYILTEDMEEKLLNRINREGNDARVVGKEKMFVAAIEQLLRGLVHTVQFAVSYIVMWV